MNQILVLLLFLLLSFRDEGRESFARFQETVLQIFNTLYREVCLGLFLPCRFNIVPQGVAAIDLELQRMPCLVQSIFILPAHGVQESFQFHDIDADIRFGESLPPNLVIGASSLFVDSKHGFRWR